MALHGDFNDKAGNKAGFDPDAKVTESGQTRLHVIAENDGDAGLKAARRLLDRSASLAGTDRYGNTPVHVAVSRGSRDLFDLFMEYGGDACLNTPNEQGDTPLTLAIRKRDGFMIDRILKAGADVNKVTGGFRSKFSPLSVAAAARVPGLIDELVRRGADVAKFEKQTNTSLLTQLIVPEDDEAATEGPAESVRDAISALLKHGANPDAVMDSSSRIALFEAIMCKRGDIVAELLEAGADPNMERHNHASPLYLAAADGHHEIVAMLLQYGAKPDGDGSHTPPLNGAVQKEAPDTVKLLLDAGADYSRSNGRYDPNAIAEAARRNSIAILKVFQDFGADMNATDGGMTPLMFAVKDKKAEATRWLVEHGADIDLQGGEDNQSALHYAAGDCDADMIALLLSCSANPCLKDDRGRTPAEILRAASWKTGAEELAETLEAAEKRWAVEHRPKLRKMGI